MIYTIDPIQWANLMVAAPQFVSQANAAYNEWASKLRAEFSAMDDAELRFRLGKEALAQSAEWCANIDPRAPSDRRPDSDVQQHDVDRIFLMAELCAEMERRGIYDPKADYTWAVKQKWREEEAARNAERVERISKWLPWRTG